MESNISKERFMNILIIHLIIENIFLFMNLFIGIFLIQQFNTSERGFLYSCIIFLIPWISSGLLVINELYHRTFSDYFNNKIPICIVIVVCLIFSPVISITLNILILSEVITNQNIISKIQFVNNYRVIIHTSLYNLTIVFIILRGIGAASQRTCLIDDLGRSACIIYPIIISVIIGFILNTIIHLLNSKNRCEIFIIVAIGNIFRTLSCGLIITYLDFWSLIPLFWIITGQTVILYTSEKNIETETDSPYGIVWSGLEWVTLQNNDTCDIVDKKQTSDSKSVNKLIPVLDGFIQIFNVNTLNFKLLLFGNISLLFVISVIFYLVNFNLTFNYEPTILDNFMFKNVVFVIIVYGVISLIQVCVDKKFYFLRQIILIFTIILPLLLFGYAKSLNTKENLCLFSINESDNTIVLKYKTFPITYDFKHTNNIMKFSKSDINWNGKAKSIGINNLIFCEELSNCLNSNSKFSINVLDHSKDLRSSSPLPTYENIVYSNSEVNVTQLKNYFINHKFVYVSFAKPNLAKLTQIVECSNVNVINTAKNYSDECDQTFLSIENKIIQRKCLKIDEDIHFLYKHCEFIDTDVIGIKNKNITLKHVEMKTKNSFTTDYCCLNSSHTIELFGRCKFYKDFFFIQTSTSYPVKQKFCRGSNWFINFIKISQNCIHKISFFRKCFQNNLVTDTCDLSNLSCKDIKNLL